ncbi:MAG TPA: hypothetical protein VNK96_00010 [Fimbriimonadales bacterium]|nr:hypothetical protein [Fimbriimonadales bacterium]
MPDFTDKELALLAELLAREHDELLVEIRRTENLELHDQLKERLELVRNLQKKLNVPSSSD